MDGDREDMAPEAFERRFSEASPVDVEPSRPVLRRPLRGSAAIRVPQDAAGMNIIVLDGRIQAHGLRVDKAPAVRLKK